MTRQPTLEIDLTLALDRFDLRAELVLTAASTGIFGPSGSGKTSLLESLAGLRREARGRLVFDNETWMSSSDRSFVSAEGRGIGWVPQDGLLFPHLDVRQNLLSGRAREQHQGSAMPFDDIVDLLELSPLLQRQVIALSGGERQRVALGRALCSAPRLLLLDEPLSSLDLPLRRRLLPLLRRVRTELTVPMILISHDPIEVQALCDQVVVLNQGEVIAHGSPREVLSDPRVFAMAEGGGYENILPGHVVERDGGTLDVDLGGGVVLHTEPPGGRLEISSTQDILLGMRADDILIATRRPQGLSARNILEARIEGLQPAEGLITVLLARDIPPVVVQVTRETPGELGLSAGQEIFLVIKATACRVYGGAEN